MPYTYKIEANDPGKAGQLAGKKMLFGDCSRYAVAPIHTRFNNLTWFVWDAEAISDSDLAQNHPVPVIRQEESFEAAVAGL